LRTVTIGSGRRQTNDHCRTKGWTLAASALQWAVQRRSQRAPIGIALIDSSPCCLIAGLPGKFRSIATGRARSMGFL
jgi:hypothetical protein